MVDLAEAIESKAVELKQGNQDELVEIFVMFDRYEPAKNIKIPSPGDLSHSYMAFDAVVLDGHRDPRDRRW